MSNYSNEEIIQFLEAKALPEDFNQWEVVVSDDGLAVAHEAARAGILPREFSQWEIKDAEGWTVAHHCAMAGTIRPGFRQWGLRGPEGRTVAHEAAKHGTLPNGFQLWNIHDGEDWTVGHEAAEHGTLPVGFDRWDINKATWSIAHEAAAKGHLFDVLVPFEDNPNQNILPSRVLASLDGNGASVAWVAIDAGHPIPAQFVDHGLWKLGAGTPYSVAHAAAVKGFLPKGFKDWNILDEEGATVAHTAAMHGTLPPRFDEWDLRDTSGWLVFEIAEEYGHYSAEQIWKQARFYEIMDHLETAESLPDNFKSDDLALCDDNGFTIAHEAAYKGLLPEDFRDWHWADKNGRTVAHEAASAGLLHEGFDQWSLADNTDWTVAHEVAQHAFDSSIPEWIQAAANQIPKEMWDAKDSEGAPVSLFFKDLPDQKPQAPKM